MAEAPDITETDYPSKLQATESTKVSLGKPKRQQFSVNFKYRDKDHTTSPAKKAPTDDEHTWFALRPFPPLLPSLSPEQERRGNLVDRNQVTNCIADSWSLSRCSAGHLPGESRFARQGNSQRVHRHCATPTVGDRPCVAFKKRQQTHPCGAGGPGQHRTNGAQGCLDGSALVLDIRLRSLLYRSDVLLPYELQVQYIAKHTSLQMYRPT